MIPEIGHFALVLALFLSLIQVVVPLVGAQTGNLAWMAVARPAARMMFVLIGIAFACLVASFLADDFSVRYVAMTSSRLLPVQYKFAAVWGGHEGSILLWLMMLGVWMLAVSVFSRHLPDAMLARILAVMGFISLGFLLFILMTSDPFERLIPAALDGNDLNPLLQDPGMVAHPPILYMGYVGLSVAFAFAIAALLGGDLDAAWARWSRPWTIVAWSFLTVGICLGSAWAYYTLGWGGWWFWDPVENASFMPWLMGTALMHSLAVTEKRGGFKVWTVLLAIFAFSLSLLGTFLVRSGVTNSVHSFASDPRRGVFILIFLGVVIGGSLALFAWRAPRVGLGGRFEPVSRETLLLSNNVLFAAAAGSVLLGTLYPLFLDALGLGKISVGPPYFDTVFVPLMVPALFLMGIGPIARWKQASLPEIATRLRVAVAVSVLTAAGMMLVSGRFSWWVLLGLWLAAWIVCTTGVHLWMRLRPAPGEPRSLAVRLSGLSGSYLGMTSAHLGVAVFVIGITMVKGYEVEKDVQLGIGQSVAIGPYSFRFKGVQEGDGPNYRYQRGTVDVLRDGTLVRTMAPEKRVYLVQTNPMTNAAIDAGLLRDLYVSLGEQVGAGSWTLRVYYKPFIDWIWGGCLLMAFGGALAVSDKRYRIARRGVAAAPARGRLATPLGAGIAK